MSAHHPFTVKTPSLYWQCTIPFCQHTASLLSTQHPFTVNTQCLYCQYTMPLLSTHHSFSFTVNTPCLYCQHVFTVNTPCLYCQHTTPSLSFTVNTTQHTSHYCQHNSPFGVTHVSTTDRPLLLTQIPLLLAQNVALHCLNNTPSPPLWTQHSALYC